MTITVDLPDDVESQLQTLAERFGSTEAALTHLIRDASTTPTASEAQISETERSEKRKRLRQNLEKLRAMAKPRGENVCYDRASFYPEAGQ